MSIGAPTIIPAIIPESLEVLSEEITKLHDVTSVFQIDIVDGVFVPYTSWPYSTHEQPEAINDHIEVYSIEFDLMIDRPEEQLHAWLTTLAKRFVIHVESTNDVRSCIDQIKSANRKIGLALNNDTPLAALDPFVSDIDYVQCMGIAEIGVQGNAFDERVLARIRTLKEHYPGLEVAVDGSVNEVTIERIYEAGATRLVSGSAILKADSPIGAYNTLLKRVL